jgi:UDP-2,3-diacylglucosamine pyrophosphatase LpxH
MAEPGPSPDAAVARDLARALEASGTAGGAGFLRLPLDLRLPHRFAIFSDQHKGARDRADAFRQCEAAYRTALTQYRDRGFTLVLLGDVEELWEQGFAEVVRHYRDVLELEASFGPDRYVRVFGNHDDEWMDPVRVAQHLAPFLPTGAVVEGLRFDVVDDGAGLGTLFLVHGHQGTLFSQRWRGVSRAVLRVWRRMQRVLGVTVRTPSTDPCLRGDHDRAMYEWAAAQSRLILIAGHTHRPVWSSRTLLQKLESALADLIAEEGDAPDFTDRLQDVEARIAHVAAASPPCRDSPKTLPVYFNTGCCIFDDGDITGMELEDGLLRLVKWPAGGGAPRVVLEEESLRSIYARLP